LGLEDCKYMHGSLTTQPLRASSATSDRVGQACPKCSEELDRFDLQVGLCPRCNTKFSQFTPVASSLTDPLADARASSATSDRVGQACSKCAEELDRFDLNVGICPRCNTKFAECKPVVSSLTTNLDNSGTVSQLHVTGELGDLFVVPLKDPDAKPRIVRELTGTKIASFAAGCSRTLAITGDGHARAVTHTVLQLEPLGGQLVQVSFGSTHMAALTRSGRVYTLGDGADGELGLGHRKPMKDISLVSSLSDRMVVQVCCGAGHTMALTHQGDVYAWGRGFEGQLGLGEVQVAASPRCVSTIREPCIQIAAGSRHSAAVAASGVAFTWGDGLCGQLGLGRCTKKSVPTLVEGLSHLVEVACGTNHTVFLDTDGAIHSCGLAARGQPFAASSMGARKAFKPQRFVLPKPHGSVVEVCASGEVTVLRSEHGAVFCFDHAPAPSTAEDSASFNTVPHTLRRIDSLKGLSLGSVATSGSDILAFAPLRIASVSPACSPLSGGAVLTLRGSGFFDSSEVLLRFTHLPTGTFRLVSGKYIENMNATTEGGCPERLVTCCAPSFVIEGPGKVSVSISFDGTFFTPPTSNSIDYYEEPGLLEVSPSAAPKSGGTAVVVRAAPTTNGAPSLFDSASASAAWFDVDMPEGAPMLSAAAAYDSAAAERPRRRLPPAGAGGGQMILICPPAENAPCATMFALALDGQSYAKSRLPFRFYSPPVFDPPPATCAWCSAEGGAIVKLFAPNSELFASEELVVRLKYKPPPPPAPPLDVAFAEEEPELEPPAEERDDAEAGNMPSEDQVDLEPRSPLSSSSSLPPPPPPLPENFDATLEARYDNKEKAIVFRMPPTGGEGSLSLAVAMNGVDFVQVPRELNTYAQLSVTSISPDLGPTQGGSRVEIRGEGLRNTEGLSVLFVSGHHRHIMPATYDEDLKCAVCESPGWDLNAAGDDAIVEVSLNGQEWTFSCRHFTFYSYEISSMEPSTGALAGGVEVVLRVSGLGVARSTPRVRLSRPPLEGNEEGETHDADATVSVEDGTITFVTPAFDDPAEPFDASLALALNGSHFLPVILLVQDTNAEVVDGQDPPSTQVKATFRYEGAAAKSKKK